MKKQVTLKMSEGQFNTDSKYTAVYHNAMSDYREACKVVGDKEIDEDDFLGQMENTTISPDAANGKGYYYKSSNSDGNTFEKLETPTMFLHLDKTNTHRTGIATLTIETK